MWQKDDINSAGLVVSIECGILVAMEIAVVDDNTVLRDSIKYILEAEGYKVSESSDGLEAWGKYSQNMPDFYILDVMMPRMDGLELCKKIRSINTSVPVLFLTSRDQEIDRVLGLELGADDYLCKPFSNRELLARIKAIMRRVQPLAPEETSNPKLLSSGCLSIYPEGYRLFCNNTEVTVTVTEFRLIESLIKHPGQVKSREQLMHAAYDGTVFVSDRTIDTHIKRIRHKIMQSCPEFDDIETVYGLGYRLKCEVLL